MTADELENVQALLKELTPGPWFLVENGEDFSVTDYTVISTISYKHEKYWPANEVLGTSEWLRAKPADLQFMAMSRDLVPKLLDHTREVEHSLNKVADYLRADIDKLNLELEHAYETIDALLKARTK